MDCLVIPLQEKLEEWKKAVINLDKEHAKGKLPYLYSLETILEFIVVIELYD